MPISGGKYVAPTWANSTTPPIDASELQDICDSIASYADPVAVVPTISNPNLLDNWYFVGGGSQQGGGQFPVNTLGQTSYSGGAIYTIDRWITLGSNTTVALTSAGMRVYKTTTGDNARNTQRIDPGLLPVLEGKQVTFSVLFDTLPASSYVGIQLLWNNSVLHEIVVTSTSDKLCSYTVTIPTTGYNASDLIYQRLQFTTGVAGATDAAVIAAVKLELGPTQTLAHQENGTWVLNEVPNFDIQYARSSLVPSVPGRYEYGTYTGTGTYGSGNQNSLTFGFVPKHVTITRSSGLTVFFNAINGCTTVRSDPGTSSSNCTVTWSGTSISLYGSSAAYQLNASSTTYYYVAIG